MTLSVSSAEHLMHLVKQWCAYQEASMHCPPDMVARNPSVERADAFRMCVQELTEFLSDTEVK